MSDLCTVARSKVRRLPSQDLVGHRNRPAQGRKSDDLRSVRSDSVLAGLTRGADAARDSRFKKEDTRPDLWRKTAARLKDELPGLRICADFQSPRYLSDAELPRVAIATAI